MEGNHINAIHQGDFISLYVDSVGYFACPAFNQPAPERCDTTSHLRAICCSGVHDLPSDFNIRCTFQIVGEKNQIKGTPVCYGSYIRLIHYATGLAVVGSNDNDSNDELNPYKCTYFKSQLSSYELKASQWQVLTRYKLRNEGDIVGEHDFIVLRNFMFKDRYLTSIPIPNGSEHLIGLRRDTAFEKLGWQIRLLLSHSNLKEEVSPSVQEKGVSKKTQERSVVSGSFVRLVHQELQGCMVCRHDDGALLSATLAPLGQVCQKLVKPLPESLGVFVRPRSVATDPRSALSVWEILPRNRSKLGPLADGDAVMFRHLLTGQYLCVRQPQDKDTGVLYGGSRNGITRPLMAAAVFVSVATTTAVDETVVFIVHSVDITDSSTCRKGLKYNDNVYFVHEQTRTILRLKSLGDYGRRHDSNPPPQSLDGNVSDSTPVTSAAQDGAREWEEYIGDTPLQPCTLSKDIAVLSEAYRILAVSEQEVKDILYVSKFLPLTHAAMALLQHTPRMDDVYLPLFRHFNAALHSLIEWVSNESHSDGSLLPHPSLAASTADSNLLFSRERDDSTSSRPLLKRDTSVFVSGVKGTQQSTESMKSDTRMDSTDTIGKSSSISPWIGRGLPPYTMASIPEAIVRDRDTRPSTKINTYRQNLISDSRLLDILLFVTTIVFRSVKLYMTNIDEGATHTAEVDMMLKVPAPVTGSCVLIHDLIHGCVVQNRRNSVRILAVKDTLVNLMDQEILGWKPPIETLLISLQSTKAGTVLRERDTFSPTNVFSSDDINNLIKKTYDLYMSNKESAVHVLDLLSTLCSPGKIPDKIFQDLITRTVFSSAKQRNRRISRSSSGLFGHVAAPDKTHGHSNQNEHHSLLFSTRRFRGSWEVHFRSNAKFDVDNMSVRSEKIELLAWEDMMGLKEMFVCATEKSHHTPNLFQLKLTIKQVISLLEQLGLGGYSLCHETGALYEADFSAYARWFWSKRKIYFPSPVAVLNNMCVGEVMAIIDSDDTHDLDIDKLVLDMLRDSSSDDDHTSTDQTRISLSLRAHSATVNRALGIKLPSMVEEDGREDDETNVSLEKVLLLRSLESLDRSSRASSRDRTGEISQDWRKRQSLSQFDQSLMRKMLMTKVPSFDIGEFNNFKAVDGNRVAGLDKSDMTHLGVFLRSSWFKRKKDMLQQKRIASQNWMGIDTALTVSSFERNWFRKALVLLAELCRGRNTVSQASVSEILPASLLLQIIEHGKVYDKTLACNLLLNVYVEHDLVFAPMALTCSQPLVCSVNTLKLQTHFECGKLFSNITCMYRDENEPEPHQLRLKLWQCIRRDMMSLAIVGLTSEETGYYVALLRVVRQLLLHGFFNDSQCIAEAGADTYSDTVLVAVHENVTQAFSAISSMFGLTSDIFDGNYIEKLLLDKIMQMMHSYRVNKEMVSQGVVDSMSRAVDLNRLTVDEFDTLFRRAETLSDGGYNLGMRFMQYIDDYFTSSFSAMDYMDLIVEILSILEVTSDMTKLQQTSQILGLLESPQDYFPKQILSAVLTAEDPYIPSAVKMPTHLERKVNTIQNSITRQSDKYMDALFATSLYNDDGIKRTAYQMMCKRATNKLGIVEMLSSLKTVVTGEEEIVVRLIKLFRGLLQKYEIELRARDFFGDSVAMMACVTYCFESLLYLSQTPFVVNTRPTGYPDESLGLYLVSSRIPTDLRNSKKICSFESVDDDDTGSAASLAPAVDVSIDYGHLIHWDRPCLFRNNIEATANSRLYSEKKPRPQTEHIFEPLLDTYLDKLHQITAASGRTNGLKAWELLTANSQLLVDTIMYFCANMVTASTAQKLLSIAHIAVDYVWACEGASHVIAALCTHFDFIQSFDNTHAFLNKVLNIVDNCSFCLDNSKDYGRAICSVRILCAIVSSDQDSVTKRFCLGHIRNNILHSDTLKGFIVLSVPAPSEFTVTIHVHLIRIVFYYLQSMLNAAGTESVIAAECDEDCSERKGAHNDREEFALVAQCIPIDFCNAVLSSSTTPLQIKRYVYSIASRIYSAHTVPIFHYMKTDLTGIHRLITNSSEYLDGNRLQPIVTDLCEYILACCQVLLDAGYEVEYFSGEEVNGPLENAIQSKNVKLLKPNGNLHSGNIGSVPSQLYFQCVLGIYAFIRLPALKDVVDMIISDVSKVNLFLKMIGLSYWLYCSFHPEILMSTYEIRTIKGHLRTCFDTTCQLRSQYLDAMKLQDFLRKHGLSMYVKAVKEVLEPEPLDEYRLLSEPSLFYSTMDFTPVVDIKELRESALYLTIKKHLHVTAEFLEHGGDQLLRRAHGELNESNTLRKMTDFDKWLYGGGRHIMNISSFLTNCAESNTMSLLFLHIMCDLLHNNVDDIRLLKKPLKTRMALVAIEVARLQRLQNAFKSYGMCNLVIALVGKSYGLPLSGPFVLQVMPLALKLGDALMTAGNFEVKEGVMANYKSSVMKLDSNGKYFVLVLRNVLRGIVSVLDEYLLENSCDQPATRFPITHLKILVQVYKFCSNLCSGHFFKAKHFLRHQHKAGEPVDLVLDIASTMNSLLQVFCSHTRYIISEQFYDRLAPYVWKSNPDVKRKFIAWHDANSCYKLQSQLMMTLVDGFQALTEITQGPCVENQRSALSATTLCPDVLEYVGAMQLRASSAVTDARRFGDRNVIWDGGNPLSFYRRYKTEMKNLGIFDEDPNADIIRETVKIWTAGKKSKKVSVDALGIDLELFHTIGRSLEQSCLRFLLALLEASTDYVTSVLCGKLNEDILLQNMENLYKLSFESRGRLKEYRTAATVSYLTLISTMASAHRAEDSTKLDDLLDDWKDEKAKEGFNTEKLVGSVELSTADGKVQRVYFPIPKFVRVYWPYPAVQKAKDLVVWTVNRESAEDKLADFYDQMQGLLHVMRRQERLKNILTPPVHALVGGTNVLANNFILIAAFKMRMMLFVLTVFFCTLFSYIQFREVYPFIQEQQPFFDYFWDWEHRDLALGFAQIGHVALSATLFVRAAINSPAADASKPIVMSGVPNNGVLRVLGSMMSFLGDFYLIMSTELWSLCVVGFSVLALYINPFWYAPILLDLVPQVRLMSFLLDAIKRNIMKILYSLVMAIILLYIFAVVAYMFFQNQYSLADKHACTDVISCFMLHVDFGLLSPPEWIGEGYIDPFMGQWFESKVYGKILSVLAGTSFNLIYIILFNLVLQAIISGFIVDTFGAMRAEQEVIEEDIKARCFICSIDRDDFEQMDIPFCDHVKFEHNMWHYLWFWIHLESKDPLSYTGPEQYASLHYANKNAFVRLNPIKKSLSIMRRVGKAKEELTLTDILKSINEHSALVSRAINTEEESRTAIRLQLDDQDAILGKLMSSGGLGQFSSNVSRLLEKLNTRLARIEKRLQHSGPPQWSTSRPTRRRDDDESSSSSGDGAGDDWPSANRGNSKDKFMKPWRRINKENTVTDGTGETDGLPVRHVLASTGSGSIGASSVFGRDNTSNVTKNVTGSGDVSIATPDQESITSIRDGLVSDDNSGLGSEGDAESRWLAAGAAVDGEISAAAVAAKGRHIWHTGESDYDVASDADHDDDSGCSSLPNSPGAVEVTGDIQPHAVLTEQFDFGASTSSTELTLLTHAHHSRRIFTLDRTQSSIHSDVSMSIQQTGCHHVAEGSADSWDASGTHASASISGSRGASRSPANNRSQDSWIEDSNDPEHTSLCPQGESSDFSARGVELDQMAVAVAEDLLTIQDEKHPDCDTDIGETLGTVDSPRDASVDSESSPLSNYPLDTYMCGDDSSTVGHVALSPIIDTLVEVENDIAVASERSIADALVDAADAQLSFALGTDPAGGPLPHINTTDRVRADLREESEAAELYCHSDIGDVSPMPDKTLTEGDLGSNSDANCSIHSTSDALRGDEYVVAANFMRADLREAENSASSDSDVSYGGRQDSAADIIQSNERDEEYQDVSSAAMPVRVRADLRDAVADISDDELALSRSDGYSEESEDAGFGANELISPPYASLNVTDADDYLADINMTVSHLRRHRSDDNNDTI